MKQMSASAANKKRSVSVFRQGLITALILVGLILAFLFLWLYQIGTGYFGSYIDRNEQINSVMSLNGGLNYTAEEAQTLAPLQAIWDDFCNSNLAEEVWTVSSDGSHLHGKFYNQGFCRTVLVLPRYNATEESDFLYGNYFVSTGFNLLLTTPRAHGQSEGAYCGFGYLEKEDVAAWVSFLTNELGSEEIILYGEGMGANSVLFYMGQGAIDPSVRFLIVESPYLSLKEQAVYTLQTVHEVPYIPFGLAIAWTLNHSDAGYQLSDVQLQSSTLSGATLPALFLWGDADDYVPSESSQSVYENYPAEKQFISSNCRHGLLYSEEQAVLERELNAWIQRYCT